MDLGTYVAENAYGVSLSGLGSGPWNLERPEVGALMDNIRQAGVPLREYIAADLYYGIKTGLNQAFLIDAPARDRLLRDDPRSEELLRPYLRGQDIKRWAPEWAGLWMIVLKSSENHAWPWSDAGEAAEEVLARTYPAVYGHLKPFEARLRKRQNQGRFWWELRSCTYYQKFEEPKIVYQEIQFHPTYGLDADGFVTNNKAFFLPNPDLYLLAVLNSPLGWWYNWRYLPHMKDEALNPQGEMMEHMPVAPPTVAVRAKIEPAVERLISLAKEQRATAEQLADWLRAEFDVAGVGQQPAGLAALDEDGFVREASRRRPQSAGRLSPGDVGALRAAYRSHVHPIRAGQAEVRRLEADVAALVNKAYGLTADDVDLMWRTAPPRMPGPGPQTAARLL